VSLEECVDLRMVVGGERGSVNIRLLESEEVERQ